jgi:hypothetical protein
MAVGQVVVGAISIQGKSQSNIVKGDIPAAIDIYSCREMDKCLKRTHVSTINDNDWNICQQNAQSRPVTFCIKIFYI